MMQLGGNIELSGFNDVDGGSMVILKKIVGNYVKKMNESTVRFEKLALSMKKQGSNFQIQAKLLDDGKEIASDASDKNLFVTLDQALTKVMSEIKK